MAPQLVTEHGRTWPELLTFHATLHGRLIIAATEVAGRGSSIGSASPWHASGPQFDPHVRHILLWRLGHEKISMAIFPFPPIQEEQLSVTGERMCTNYW